MPTTKFIPVINSMVTDEAETPSFQLTVLKDTASHINSYQLSNKNSKDVSFELTSRVYQPHPLNRSNKFSGRSSQFPMIIN